MKTKIYKIICIMVCILMLVPAITANVVVAKDKHFEKIGIRPGWVSVKITVGFVNAINVSNASIVFNATLGTFYATFQPLTIKRYHRNEQIVVGIDSVRFKLITKHFVFIIATAISPPPYTICILDGNEIIPV